MNHDTTDGRKTDEEESQNVDEGTPPSATAVDTAMRTEMEISQQQTDANQGIDRRSVLRLLEAGALAGGLGILPGNVTASEGPVLRGYLHDNPRTVGRITISDIHSYEQFCVDPFRSPRYNAFYTDENGNTKYVIFAIEPSYHPSEGFSSGSTFEIAEIYGICGTGSYRVGYVQVVDDPNASPVAAFTHAPDSSEVGEEITFDASGSSDLDGAETIASYDWDFGDDTTGTGQVTTHTYTAEGNYGVTLTVTDDDGATDTETQTVNVAAANNSPIANAGPAQTVSEGDTVTLDGSGSSDPDEEDLTYAWTQTGGPTVDLSEPSSPRPMFTAPAVDEETTLTFELEVSDGSASDTDTVAVTVGVQPENELPTAAFDYSAVGEEVTFTDESSDSDGSIASWSWDFGDGTTTTEQNPTHTYAESGTYTVTLSVTDDAGATATTEGTVTVEAAPTGGDAVFEAPLEVRFGSPIGPPQDLDGDGLYEDVDGDGDLDRRDTVDLARIIYNYRRGYLTLSDAQVDALDFRHDGKLNRRDVRKHYRLVIQSRRG